MKENSADHTADSCRCPSGWSSGRKTARRIAPVAGGILIALLPKCPFCILAYSSAVTMCSGATVYDHQPAWFSFVSIALGLLVIFSIARNYRGARSLLALGMALGGALLVCYSELRTGNLNHYRLGAFLLLSGALLNGGLYVVLRSLAAKAKKRLLQS
jgi:hypothetical protein